MMDLRAYIEGREGAVLRALYSSEDVWPDWRRLMWEMPESENERTQYFENVCSCVLSRIKFKFTSMRSEENLDGFERILNLMSERALTLGHASKVSRSAKSCQSEREKISIQYSEDVKAFLALNRVARKGWTRVIEAFKSGVGSGVETVDGHSVKTAILAGLMCAEAFERLFLMGLVHDHAEQWIGDLTPSEVVDRNAKKRYELSVYRKMVMESCLSDAKKLFVLGAFERCIMDDTVESCLIHIADKLDMAMQAWVYERQYNVDLQEFFDSAAADIDIALDKMMTLKKNCDT